MTAADLADVLASALFITGSALALVAAVGLVRFPDLLARMHAGAKPQVLGLVFMVAGLAIHVRSPRIAGPLLLVLIFQVVTTPVATHMVGRAGYRTGRIRHELLVRDELTDDLEAAHRLAAERGARRQRPSGDDGR